MGVHSVPDVIGGFFLTILLLSSFISFGDYLDDWLIHSPSAPYLPTIFLTALLLVYPRPNHFVVTYGDTAMIAGVGNGIALSSHLITLWQYPSIPLNWLQGVFLHSFLGLLLHR